MSEIVTLPSPLGASTLAGVAVMSVTTSSSNIALPNAGGNVNVVTILNDGAQEAFLAFGEDDTVKAVDSGNALNSIPVPAGARFCMHTATSWMAAITASSGTTLRVLMGNGAFFG
jgi:hypothetical protein